MSELVYLPIEQLWPHPDNPRKVVDDLDELTASIKEKGILQNLTVVHVSEHTMDESERRKVFEETQKNGVHTEAYKKAKELLDAGSVPEHYTVIIGHRRLAAAKEAGLKEVPCVIAEMTEKEQIQTMLLENMQRKDLKLYEEAQSFQMLLDFGDSVEDISQASGFSTTTIRRRVKLTELNQNKLKEVVDTRQIALGDFDKLAQIEDIKTRNSVLEEIGTENFNYAVSSALRDQGIKKYLPIVKTSLRRLKAKKINQSETWGTDYEKVGEYKVHEWDKNQDRFPKETDMDLFYVLDDRWGELKLYKKAEKQRTTVRRSKEEIEAEKKRRAKWDYIKSQSEIFRSMRKKFIDDLVVTDKNKMLILQGAIIGGLFGDICYNGSYRTGIVNLLGFEENYRSRNKDFLELLWKVEQKDYAKLVWCMFNDDERCTVIGGYEGNEPKYDPNYKIIAVYEWLKTLGYEMSEAEKNLVYGKDKVYDKDSEAPTEPVPTERTAEDQDGETGEV